MTVIIIIAFIIDFILGDPRRLPHPIILIGNAISFFERIIRGALPATARYEKIGGAVLVIIIVSLSFILPYILLKLLYSVSYPAGVILEVVFCWQILAAKSLQQAAMKVYSALRYGSLAEARRAILEIVGRDTESLDDKSIIKAAVETVAENTTDGVTAPLLFLFIGGAPLGFLYKATNTLDSMVGYKNDKYINFGITAAKLDDLLNYIPSRVTGGLYIVSAFILRLDWRSSYRVFLRDRFNHASPNSAQTESACAGALNIMLGGDAYYFGKLYHKQSIGDDTRPPIIDDIISAIKLMYLSSCMAIIIFAALRYVIERVLI